YAEILRPLTRDSLRGLFLIWALLDSPVGDFLSFCASRPSPEH
ncbi:hypothetical protein A2U01_0063439, partial [Trifolium medium]|nr:hypothetical protein [Trifolium medium]